MAVKLALNLEPWSKLLEKLADKTRLRRFLKVLAQVIAYKEIVQHFKKNEGPEGKWPPRSESTEKTYREIYEGKRRPPEGYQRGMFKPGGALLVLSGQLSRSFSLANIRADQESVTLFNPIEYAGVHDEGGDVTGARRAGHVPQRKFMWVSQQGLDLMAKGLTEKLAGPG